MTPTCETCRWWRESDDCWPRGRFGFCLNPINDDLGENGERRAKEVGILHACPEHTPKPKGKNDD